MLFKTHVLGLSKIHLFSETNGILRGSSADSHIYAYGKAPLSTGLLSYLECQNQTKGRRKCWDDKSDQHSQRLEILLSHLCPHTSIFQSVQFSCQILLQIIPLQTLEMLPLRNSLHSELWTMPCQLITQVYGFKHFLMCIMKVFSECQHQSFKDFSLCLAQTLWGVRGGYGVDQMVQNRRDKIFTLC